MTNPKDQNMSKEWDELLATPESLEFLTQSGEEVLKKIQNGEFLPMDAPDPEAE